MIHDGNIDGLSAQFYVVDVFGRYGVDEYMHFSRCPCLC